MNHPQYRPNVFDPLDLKIGEQQRVAIFYLLKEEFIPGTPHWMGGDVGGAEQRILEEHMRKTLNVLGLADGYPVSEILKNFIIVSGSPRELLVMLEAMPFIRGYALTQSRHSQHEVEKAIASLKSRILGLLERFDLQMVFDDDDRLVERTVDTMPKALAALLGRDALVSKLEVLLRSGEQVSLVFFDLDDFKQVNDKVSHKAGDQCLERLAETVAQVIKGRGALYRYGGDEFAVLLPNFTVLEATVTAERIRASIESANIGDPVRVTASVGVASSEHENTSNALVHNADEAHYGSKFTGKNKVTKWPMDGTMIEVVRSARAKAKGH